MIRRHTSQFVSDQRFLLAAAAAVAVGSIGSPADATAASGFVSTQLLKGQFGDLKVKMQTAAFDIKLDTRGDSNIYVTRNAIAIGRQSGWHTHPGPSLITVTAGEIVAYDAEVCAPTHYGTGETFVDPGDGHVHLFRNESGAVAETIAPVRSEGCSAAHRRAQAEQLQFLADRPDILDSGCSRAAPIARD